ncbi:MAG: tetratricopeptide repeat protein [Candidatus Hinthialibacter sp.]
MTSKRVHVFVPLGIILLASAIVFASWPKHSAEDRFDAILQAIVTAPNSEMDHLVDSAESYIRFQRRALAPRRGREDARPIADYYFLLGGALLGRPDALYLDAARRFFEQSIDLYPTLRMGWPYFELGRLYERLEDESSAERAKQYYKLVSLYNTGDLSLRAEYRILRMDLLQRADPIASQPLYHYVRFASKDLSRDLQPFAEAHFDENIESFYLQAHLACIQGATETAVQVWRKYLKQRPMDYSAQYFHDRCSQSGLKDLYPEDGDLLSSCYAPQSFQEEAIALMHNHHLRMDCYVPNPKGKTLEITGALENPFQKKILIYASISDRTQTLNLESEPRPRFVLQFSNLSERSLLNFHVWIEDDSPAAPQPLWVRVLSLNAQLASSETAS